MKKADYFRKNEGQGVECLLCPHHCKLLPEKSGICGARRNVGGELQSLNYGVMSGLAMDPIEKKPLYHYYPGSSILSVGTVGCNLHCPFCQNYPLSRYFDGTEKTPEEYCRPEDLLGTLKKELEKNGTADFGGIAYTYSEPLVWYEFVLETSALMKENGFRNVLVTNGFIEPEPLKKLLPYIDAANIDLKAFSEENYRKLGGRLKPVLETIETCMKRDVHVELTTLVVTGFNDNIFELEKAVKWIAGIDSAIPYHVSRYFPQYKYNKPATDPQMINQVKEMAKSHLKYVYAGNMNGESDTKCPQCRSVLVERTGYKVKVTGIENSACSYCGRKADFILP